MNNKNKHPFSLLLAISLMALPILLPGSALAGGGAGGSGVGTGGAGGVDSNTGAGGAGGNNSGNAGGGGGGAGATGGAGGTGAGAGGVVGAGASTAGANGGNGANGSTTGASGGGGGAHGYVGAGVAGVSVTGGNGGNGGASTGGGGGGGAGGYGAVVTGSNLTSTIGTAVRGGNGGNGGNGGGVANRFPGTGGTGGTGLLFTGSTSVITINAAVAGGNGGNTGSAVSPGIVGLGGVGIIGNDLSLILDAGGSIAGGVAGGSGGARANAISFTGGDNTLSFATPGTASITGNIAASGNLTFDQATGVDAIVANAITGTAQVFKTGGGVLTLSGTNTYNGATRVDDGSLIVNGSIQNSATTVTAGHLLGGTGTVGALTVDGVLAAGDSGIGTLNVNGNATFNNGSVFRVEVNSGLSEDLLAASGSITINGGDVDVQAAAGNYAASNLYTIITGTSVTGTFASVTSNLAFLDPTLIYNGTNVQLRMNRNNVGFSEVATDTTQIQVAGAVDSLGAGNPIFDRYTALTVAEARQALDDLSGEHTAGVTGAVSEMAGAVRSALVQHMGNLNHSGSSSQTVALATGGKDTGISAGSSYSPLASAVWIQGIGSTGYTEANTLSARQDRDSYGMITGIDLPFADAGYFGFYGGYERGRLQTKSAGSESDLNNYHAGAYATRPLLGRITISGGVNGTYHDIESERSFMVGPDLYNPTGETDGYTLSAFTEFSLPVALETMALEPFININVTRSHMDGYAEQGGGAANLVMDDVTKTNPSTVLGVRAGKRIDTTEGSFNVNGMLGWRHVYGDVENEATMRFANGSNTFDTFGPPTTEDAALVGAGFDAEIGPGMETYVNYNGAFSDDTRDHGLTLGLKWEF